MIRSSISTFLAGTVSSAAVASAHGTPMESAVAGFVAAALIAATDYLVRKHQESGRKNLVDAAHLRTQTRLLAAIEQLKIVRDKKALTSPMLPRKSSPHQKTTLTKSKRKNSF